jgi:diguanylate cyclase (GGDEF)-like protein/PAS domain S-box-containing protein
MANAQTFFIPAPARIFAQPWLWLCTVLFACAAHAAPPLLVERDTSSYAVAPHIDFLEDKGGALTITEVDAAGRSDNFRPVPGSGDNEINFGYSASAYWLRLVVDINAPIQNDLLLEVGFPSLDHVEFYSETDGAWQTQEAGDLKPFAARPVAHRNFVFPLPHHHTGPYILYLRIASSGTLTIPLRLWQSDAFDRHNQNSYAALALYFGMLLALMLYNLLLYFSLRDRNYFTYVCVVIGMAVGQLSLTGLGNQFLWPNWPAWGNVALPSGFAATAFFAALFTRGFLNTALKAPRHDRVILALAGLSAFIALSPAFLSYQFAAISTSLLGIVFPAAAASAGLVCLRRDQPGARYFLLAWTLLLCGTAILGLRNMGWVPTNFFTLYAMLIGSALEILLLSFALADRIQILRREKEQAQVEALAISRRAERELEARVEERTEELSRTNVQLRDSEQHLQLLAANASDMISRNSPDKRYLYVSAASQSMLGYAPEELVGRSCEEFIHPDDIETAHASYREIAEGAGAATVSVRLLRKDGSYLWVETNLHAVRDDAGNVLEAIAVTRDITERKRLEQRDKVRNLALEQLAKGDPLYEVLETITLGVEQERPGIFCSILLLDEQGNRLLTGAAPSLPEFYNRAVHGLQIGEGIGSCGNAAHTGQRTIVENIQTHPNWAHEGFRELAAQAGLVSCWSEPIHSAAGEILGAFAIYQQHPGAPSEADVEMIQKACNLASIAIERKRLDELMWSHANHDLLTKLPNRRLFRDRLQQELKKTQRSDTTLALMFIDLDMFKEVNDTLGHDIGDLLLVDVARRISGCVRDSDTVARISGDEFTVVMPELAETSRVEQVAQNIIHALTQPFSIGKETIYISASVGITLYPNDAAELEGLLKNADQAMYAAKKQGRNCFSYFTNRMQEEAQNRMHLIKDLRDALPAGQFQVYFQPIVDMKTGRMVKAEALLRWFHPERGMVGPIQFIPVAEETGLICDIGDWVFRESANWMSRWHERGYGCIQVSVNKSPTQFTLDASQKGWLDHLQGIGLPAACIVIEITEGLLLNERSDVTEKLLQFRDAGIQVAIDDFGTGYSSLSYLKKFDIDYLKIDQSFVRDLATDPNDLALSEAIIVMAHKLGIKVIAEGVETVEQRDMLAAAGCDYAQGFLFARPMPAEEFDALLAGQLAEKM